MHHKITDSGDQVTFSISGQLTSKDRSDFIELIPNILISGRDNIIVNMTDLTYMDSVGLGLLVTLRDEANKKGMSASISNPQGEVKGLLEMACFDRLFTIA
ncbi:MAG: STAS domain-containing protein [Rhodospirillales bacterium]|nr:STAS domain-containing protein [Rhodospirillales bacterium]